MDEELPYPPTSGKRIRTLNLTLRLARRHHITYICHRNSDPGRGASGGGVFHRARRSPFARRTGRRRRSRAPAFYARLAANLLSPLPYSAASHDSRPLRRRLREHAASHPVDLWHCEWTPYVQAVRGLPNGAGLVVAHNVESVIWRRYYETEPQPLRRWYIGRQWRKFERFERQVMGEVDRAVAVSGLDAERLRRDFGARRVDVVENGVDPAYFRPENGPKRAGAAALPRQPRLAAQPRRRARAAGPRVPGGAGGRAVGATLCWSAAARRIG